MCLRPQFTSSIILTRPPPSSCLCADTPCCLLYTWFAYRTCARVGAARTYILALVVIAALVGLAVTFLDVKTSFLAGKAWCLSQIDRLEGVLKEAGYWGPIIVFAVYFVSTIFMLPLWGFHMTCGYVYGAFYSTFLIATTQAICAGAAFLCSRHIVRPYIRGFFTRRYGRKYTAIDKASRGGNEGGGGECYATFAVQSLVSMRCMRKSPPSVLGNGGRTKHEASSVLKGSLPSFFSPRVLPLHAT